MLAAFRARTLSPVELLEAIVERAGEVEPEVNAFAETMYEAARAEAKIAEERYLAGAQRPLEGLPLAAKEAQALEGHVTSEGLLEPLDTQPAQRTAFALQRLRDAGAIVHARTTTSELCCMPMSHAVRWGVTRNPWDLTKAVGGSSGGSAAALAAGTTILATGSDIGGSIRAPACLAGVVGYKAPYGRIPMEPPVAAESRMHHGPMARTVGDAALMFNVMAGPHADDPYSLPSVPELPLELSEPAGMRIAFCLQPGDMPVAAEIVDRLAALMTELDDGCLGIEAIELDWRLADVNEAMWGHGDLGRAEAVLRGEEERPGALSPYTKECLRRSLEMAAAVPPERRATLERQIRGSVLSCFERFDALIVPAVGVVSMDAGEDYHERPLEVGDRALDHFCDACLTPVFNIASCCPVLSVPAGFVPVEDRGAGAVGVPSAGGLPTGVQVVGPPHDDLTAFRVAAAIERRLPADRWRAVRG